jgi:hypothetical protein
MMNFHCSEKHDKTNRVDSDHVGFVVKVGGFGLKQKVRHVLLKSLIQVPHNDHQMIKFYCSENMTKQISSTLIGYKQAGARRHQAIKCGKYKPQQRVYLLNQFVEQFVVIRCQPSRTKLDCPGSLRVVSSGERR